MLWLRDCPVAHIVVNVSQGSAALNREQKLALIVGFSVVLLVGILLTDHLSQARTDKMDGIASREGSFPSLSDTTPRSAYAREAEPAIQEVALGGETEATQGNVGNENGQPIVLNQDPMTADSPIDDPMGDPLVDLPSEIAQGQSDPAPSMPSARELAQMNGLASGETPGLAGAGSGTLTMGGQTQDLPRAHEQDVPSIIDPLGTETPDPAWYTVKPNESLYVISKRFYGKGTLWRKLAAHNVGRVGEDGTIRSGVRLQIPHPSVVIGPGATYANAPEQPAAKKPSKAKPAKTPAKTTPPATTLASVKTRDYTIKVNDCLSKIAQDELGTIRRQKEILALNTKLTDADDIRSGMVIQLPAS